MNLVLVADELRRDNTIWIIHWWDTTGLENAISEQPLAGDQVETLQKTARTLAFKNKLSLIPKCETLSSSGKHNEMIFTWVVEEVSNRKQKWIAGHHFKTSTAPSCKQYSSTTWRTVNSVLACKHRVIVLALLWSVPQYAAGHLNIGWYWHCFEVCRNTLLDTCNLAHIVCVGTGPWSTVLSHSTYGAFSSKKEQSQNISKCPHSQQLTSTY